MTEEPSNGPAPSAASREREVVHEWDRHGYWVAADQRGREEQFPTEALCSAPEPVEPIWPEALRAQFEGDVVLRLAVDERGSVTHGLLC